MLVFCISILFLGAAIQAFMNKKRYEKAEKNLSTLEKYANMVEQLALAGDHKDPHYVLIKECPFYDQEIADKYHRRIQSFDNSVNGKRDMNEWIDMLIKKRYFGWITGVPIEVLEERNDVVLIEDRYYLVPSKK